MDDPLNQIGLFFGDTTPVSADVHAVWHGQDKTMPSLSGHLYGPLCEHARTLPTKSFFRDVLEKQNFLGTAFIPDPCYWTPNSPYYYRATLELKSGNRTETIEQEIGLRTLGVKQRDLWLAGKRWVLRAVDADSGALDPLLGWHAAGAAMVTSEPNENLLRDASRQGVLLVADLTAWVTERAIDMLLYLARWSAVGVVILPDDVDGEMLEPSIPFSYLTTNLLLAQRFNADEADRPIEPADWADLAVCYGSPAEIARRSAYCEIPVLAHFPTAGHEDIASARRACDLLQRELAPYRDYAGYIV